MIVQPNFLDHWKTRLLQTELGDDVLAHTYVLRLWGHCQEQKTHKFTDLSAGALAAICRFKGAPEILWLAMQTSKFITVKKTVVEVHQWNEYNQGLLTSWQNGRKGGRPRKTRGKPAGNPRQTRGKPASNPLKTDREDGIEKIEKIENTNLPPPPAGSGGSEQTPPPPPKQKPRNVLLDTLATVGGGDPKEVPPSAWSGVQKALEGIKAVTPDVTPAEIRRRAENYRTHFREAAISPQALEKHWARCAKPAEYLRPGQTRAATAEEHNRGFLAGTEFEGMGQQL